MVMLVEVKGVGSFRIPEGTQAQDIRAMTDELRTEQDNLARLQSGEELLPGAEEALVASQEVPVEEVVAETEEVEVPSEDLQAAFEAQEVAYEDQVEEPAAMTPLERIESDREQLAFDEGRRNKPYKDGKGHWTAGIGHLMSKDEKKEYPPGSTVPDEVVDKWFAEDIAEAYQGTERILKKVGIPDLPAEAKSILTNMVFNMGVSGVLEFKETLKLLKKGDYKAASVEMLDSDWHRIDVGPRAVRLSDRMAKVQGFSQVADNN
jgi:lysozyme